MIGVIWVVLGIFSPTKYFVGVGIGFLLMSVAELLPRGRTGLAGFLRLGAMIAALMTLVVLLWFAVG